MYIVSYRRLMWLYPLKTFKNRERECAYLMGKKLINFPLIRHLKDKS